MRIDPMQLVTRSLPTLLLWGAAVSSPIHLPAQATPAEVGAERTVEQETDVVQVEERAADTAGEPDIVQVDEAATVEVEPTEGGDRISILGGSRTIAENESVRDVLVIGGNLEVRGTVRGDAVVVGGNVTLHPTGRIRGDVVVAGGRFRNLGGNVEGEMRTMDRLPAAATAGAETREAVRTEAPRQRTAFRRVGSGIAGIFSTAALALVLAAIGAAVVFYAQRYLETVADTLRASTSRSALVGLAASFLAVPAFVVLVVALVVSIVGIPLLILAVPLYPLAVVAASLFGLVAAAYALGEHTSEQRGGYDVRYRNAYAYLMIGLVIFFAPVMAGHLIGMTPFLGWVGGLVKFIAYGMIWIAMLAGLGAVILSRGGTRRTFARRPPRVEEDPLLDDDPFLEKTEV